MTVSNFVKYIYVSGEKMARNDCKMVKCKSCAFHFESESKLQNSHNCSKVLKPSLFLLQTASGNALEFVWWGKMLESIFSHRTGKFLYIIDE